MNGTPTRFLDYVSIMLLTYSTESLCERHRTRTALMPNGAINMPATAKTSYSRYTLAAVRHLGQLVKLKRIERRISAAEFASRIGVARGTLHRLERGDPTVALGIAFEACTFLSIPLFEEDRARLTARIHETDQRLALLPKAARARAVEVDDDF